MNTIKLLFAALTLLAIGVMLGCSGGSAKSPDVSDNIRNSLDQAGFKNISVKEDRDKGVVLWAETSPLRAPSHRPNHLLSPWRVRRLQEQACFLCAPTAKHWALHRNGE
jgi:hypothetical protein